MERPGAISRAEWRWLVGWITVALMVTSVPYAIGALRSTPDHVFGGFAIAVEDGYSYLAKMNQGAHGAWTFTLPYTSEPHTPTIFYAFHLLLGKAAALTGLSFAAMYHLARMIFDAALLAVIYRFVAQFSRARAIRKLAWLIIAFSGGLGWLLLLTGQSEWLGSFPIDLISPEGFSFLILYGFPHLALARSLLLAGLLAWWTGQRWVLAGACWLAMSVIVPFYVAVVGAIVMVGLITDALTRRRIVWGEIGRAALAGLIASPMLIYTFVIVAADPIWRVWSDQLVILSPHPLHYVAGYAVVGALAVVGLRRRSKSEVRNPKLIGWLLIVPLLIYLPFNSQRRLIESWQLPLAMLAAAGLAYTVLPAWRRSRVVRRLIRNPRYSVRGLTNWFIAGTMLLTSATYVLVLTEQSLRLAAQTPPSFRDGREIDALRWLDKRVTPDDVILSSYETGNFLPTLVNARAFLGHGPETAYSDEKRELVKRFYRTDTPAEWRRSFLQQWPIGYVIAGPLEAKLGTPELDALSELVLIYDQAGYRIYRVMERRP